MLDAAVRTINRFHKKTAYDFGLSLGDALNSRGYYMGVIDGKTPDGKIADAGPVANF